MMLFVYLFFFFCFINLYHSLCNSADNKLVLFFLIRFSFQMEIICMKHQISFSEEKKKKKIGMIIKEKYLNMSSAEIFG